MHSTLFVSIFVCNIFVVLFMFLVNLKLEIFVIRLFFCFVYFFLFYRPLKINFESSLNFNLFCVFLLVIFWYIVCTRLLIQFKMFKFITFFSFSDKCLKASSLFWYNCYYFFMSFLLFNLIVLTLKMH